MEARALKDKRSVSWNTTSETEKLSEKFLRDNEMLINWYLVSGHQQVSEAFIREFSGRLYWDEAIRTQKVSEAFITHLDKMDAANLIEHKDFRPIKNYNAMDVYVIAKNGRRKYILKFERSEPDGLTDIYKADEDDLLENLEEYGLVEQIEKTSPNCLLEKTRDNKICHSWLLFFSRNAKKRPQSDAEMLEFS